jgi:hypothetical protein
MDSCHPTEGVQLARQHCRTKSARNEIEMVGAGDGISRAIPEIRTQRSSAWVSWDGIRGSKAAATGAQSMGTKRARQRKPSYPRVRRRSPARSAPSFSFARCAWLPSKGSVGPRCVFWAGLGWAALQRSAFYFFSLSHPPSITEFIDLGQGLFAISQ